MFAANDPVAGAFGGIEADVAVLDHQLVDALALQKASPAETHDRGFRDRPRRIETRTDRAVAGRTVPIVAGACIDGDRIEKMDTIRCVGAELLVLQAWACGEDALARLGA